MESGQKRDLEQMRDKLVERINTLEDQERYGTISAEERNTLLENEFGTDYYESLSQINQLLAEDTLTDKHAPTTLIRSVVALMLFGIAFGTFFAFTPTAFMVLGTETFIEPNLLLQSQESQILDLPEQAVLSSVTVTEQTTLTLEDAYRTIPLYEEGRCVGCGQRIHAPYLITNTGDSYTTITTIGVIQE